MKDPLWKTLDKEATKTQKKKKKKKYLLKTKEENWNVECVEEGNK